MERSTVPGTSCIYNQILDGVTVEQFPVVSAALLKDCSDLFNAHYATWADSSARRGARVRLSPKRIREECIPDERAAVESGVVQARLRADGRHIGHALYVKFLYSDGPISNVVWITQLVVHPDYRHNSIATKLIQTLRAAHRTAWAFGLATSHPYTVKALERAIGQPCDSVQTKAHAAAIVQASRIKYLQNRDITITESPVKCTIDTQFDINHELVDEARTMLGQAWKLGDLGPGEEHLAIVFSENPSV